MLDEAGSAEPARNGAASAITGAATSAAVPAILIKLVNRMAELPLLDEA